MIGETFYSAREYKEMQNSLNKQLKAAQKKIKKLEEKLKMHNASTKS